MINIKRDDFYEYKKSKERTKKRLQQLNRLGLEECGIAEFGIKGVLSGLYIERVWNDNDEEWMKEIEWIKKVKKKNNI